MNFFKHLSTVRRHRKAVRKLCFKVGLIRQGLTHDLSKYSKAEFRPGVKYYQGDRSPNNAEREDKGYTSAWLHHKGRNKHHLEYWLDYNTKDGGMTGMKMPVKYVVEMFCDRVAASKIYYAGDYDEGKPYEYFKKGCAGRTMHPETGKQLEELLVMLRDKGEKETFSYIKNVIRVQGKRDKEHWK